MMKDGNMSSLHMVAWVLVIVGALNWGLVGLLDFNLVTAIFGGVPWLETLIYILVGLSGVVALVGMMNMKKK